MIENRFLHFLTQEAFNRKRSEIPNNSIVFIDKGAFDKPEIWTHGKCYSNTEDIYDLESIATKVVANPSDAASAVLNKIKIANTVYSIGSGQGPVTYGSLVTDNEEGHQPSSGEMFNGTINLNRIAKTGSYKHLVDLPTGVFTNFLAFDDDHGFMDSGYNSTSFQAKLTPGNGIKIENGVISTTGNQGGGDSVAWDQIQNSGTKIASITINGNSTNVYAPNSDGGTGSTVTMNPLLHEGTEIADYTIDGVEGTLFAPTPINVVANPSGTTNVALTKIKIGNNVYNVGGTSAVTSVNGKTGAVTITADDLNAQSKLSTFPAHNSVGSSTKVPVITTNAYGQVISLTTENIDFSDYAKTSALDALQAQIDALYAQLVGITVTATPRSRVVKGQQVTIDVAVSTTEQMGGIVIYRDGVQKYSSNTEANSWSYPDIVTPSTTNDIEYKVVVTKGGTSKEKFAYVKVNDVTNISWSSDSAIVYLNRMSGENSYPELKGAEGLTITYSASPTSIATINSTSGVVNPRAVGTCTITATSNEGSTASYTLTVENDTLQEIIWDGGGISKTSLTPGEQATLTKGNVYARYKSGDVTVNNAQYTKTGGSISGNTYTAPSNAGTYYIGVTYNNMESTQKITVTVSEPVPQKLTVQVGHGPDYENAAFIDTGDSLHDDTVVTISNNKNDYLFIKTDVTDVVTNFYANADSPRTVQSEFELDNAIIDGNYHYYKTQRPFARAFNNIKYVINRSENFGI